MASGRLSSWPRRRSSSSKTHSVADAYARPHLPHGLFSSLLCLAAAGALRSASGFRSLARLADFRSCVMYTIISSCVPRPFLPCLPSLPALISAPVLCSFPFSLQSRMWPFQILPWVGLGALSDSISIREHHDQGQSCICG